MARKNVKAVDVKTEELKAMAPEEAVATDEISKEAPVGALEVEKISEDALSVTLNETDQLADNEEGLPEEIADTGIENELDSDVLNEEATADKEQIAEVMFDSLQELEFTPCKPLVIFKSDSEMARCYTLELLADRESHKKQEIVGYITERSGKVFSDAVVINTLRNLVASGSLMQLERGSYRIGTGVGLVSKLVAFIDSTRKGLDKISLVSVSDITESDMSAIQDLKALKSILDVMHEKLTSN